LRTASKGPVQPWQEEAPAVVQPTPSNTVGEGGSSHMLALDESSGSALLLVLAFLYAVNAPLLKSLEGGEANGIELILLRFVFSVVPVLPWLVSNFRDAARHVSTGVELGFWLWAGYTLQCLALDHCSASKATVIFALCGLMVQALEAVFDKKPLSMPTVLSTLGALAGLGIFVSASTESAGGVETGSSAVATMATTATPLLTMLESVPGEALCLLGTFFFAVHVWRSAALGVEGGDDSNEASEDNDKKLLSLAALQMVTAAMLEFGLWWFSSTNPLSTQFSKLLSLDSDVWLRMAFSGVLMTSFPHVLELFALRVTPAAKAALIYCTIPVWGVLLSVLVLGEPLSSQAAFGGLLILGCSIPWSTLLPSSGNEEKSSIGAFIEAAAPRAALSSAVLTLAPLAEEAVTLGGSTTGSTVASQSVAVAAPANQAAAQAASGAVSGAVSAGPTASAAAAGTAPAANSSVVAGLASKAPGVQAMVQSSSVAAASAGPATQAATGAAVVAEAPAAASVAHQMVAGAASGAASAATSPVGQRVTSDAASTAISRMAAPAAQAAAPAVQAVSDVASAAVASAAASPAGQAAASAASTAATSAIPTSEVASAAAAAAANPVAQATMEAASSAGIANAAPAAHTALEATSTAASVVGTVSQAAVDALSAASAGGISAEAAVAAVAAAAAIIVD